MGFLSRLFAKMKMKNFATKETQEFNDSFMKEVQHSFETEVNNLISTFSFLREEYKNQV